VRAVQLRRYVYGELRSVSSPGRSVWCRERRIRSFRRGRRRPSLDRRAWRGWRSPCRSRGVVERRNRTPLRGSRGNLSGIRSQMPTVRSPCTLLCPRTGQTPAPGLPMLPRKRRKLTISCTLATAFTCCVNPMAQHTMVRSDGSRPRRPCGSGRGRRRSVQRSRPNRGRDPPRTVRSRGCDDR
jgi:hypothetical protein